MKFLVTRLNTCFANFIGQAGNEVQTCEDIILAHAWFSDDRNCDGSTYMYEQNVVMKSYDSVLTLLWEAKI
jgi:hypothetical protein